MIFFLDFNFKRHCIITFTLFKEKDLTSECSDLEKHLRTPGADGAKPQAAAEQRNDGLKLILRTRQIQTPQPQHGLTDNTNNNRIILEPPYNLSGFVYTKLLLFSLLIYLLFILQHYCHVFTCIYLYYIIIGAADQLFIYTCYNIIIIFVCLFILYSSSIYLLNLNYSIFVIYLYYIIVATDRIFIYL